MTFLRVLGFLLKGWAKALRRKGWKSEEEEQVYQKYKDSDLLGGPAFNMPES